MTERRDRINRLCDALCRGKRYEAADRHVEASRTFLDRPTQVRYDYLAGWDAAMELKSAEILDENITLHQMIFALCVRLAVKRCEKCKGVGFDLATVEKCEYCDDGWADTPQGEAEQVVQEIRNKLK